MARFVRLLNRLIMREQITGGSGLNILTAAIVLALLIAPTMIVFFVNGLRNVPAGYCLAVDALGGRPVQKLLYLLLPQAWPTIVAGIIMGLGRAMGDTLISLMVAGNSVAVPGAVVDSGRTLTAHIALVIAADFSSMEFRTIFACGLVLYIFTVGVVCRAAPSSTPDDQGHEMRKVIEHGLVLFSWASTLLLFAALLYNLGYLVLRGGGVLSADLLFGDVAPVDALLGRKQVFDGLLPAIAGTFALVLIAVGLAVPVGIGAGIYMAEYARGTTRQLLNVLFDILAGLPSIIVGLAGFSLTIVLHRLLPGRIGPCLLISALALSFLILPYLIRSTQMAVESVPLPLRRTAPAMGATQLQNILYVLLPNRLPDILGGIILAIGRAAEDTAVIMLTGVVASAGLPRSLFEQFEAVPFYIYYISSQYTDPGELRTGFGAAILLLAICALLFVLAFITEQIISWQLRR